MSPEQKKGCDGRLTLPHLEANGYEKYPEYFFNLPHRGGTRVSCKETEPSKIVDWLLEKGKEFHASPVILLILGIKAKGLIAGKTITNPEKFKEYLDAAKNHIQDKINEIVQHNIELGEKTREERKRGGSQSWGLEPDQRKERDKIIQKEVERLCFEAGLSYTEACKIVSYKISNLYPLSKELSFERVKQITTNPIKKKKVK